MHRKLINFICFNKTYPIELSLFNKHSNFFLNENKIDENIYLLNDNDFFEVHTKESIKEFIKYFQDQSINLQASNVISIQALSMKYLVNQLQKDTDQFIKEHYNEVIEYYFSTKKSRAPNYEELISAHFIEYSKDDRLYQLPISTLYRIQQLFMNKIKKEENTEQIKIQYKTIIDFLIKTVSIFGHDSLIFISSNKFNEEQFKYLNTQMSKNETRNTLEILTSFLQSNASYIIEYKKYKKKLKDEETKKLETIVELFKKKN